MEPGKVRIIGGKWRGRKLKVPSLKGLRPTPDRVRETLFNWLADVIAGARCLDLFTGSGALGFEALSRGAAYVEMIDQNNQIVAVLKEELIKLGAVNGQIFLRTVPHDLLTPEKPFDIVFLDPPYGENLLIPTCESLEKLKFLNQTAYIYLESNSEIKDSELPKNWKIIKSKKAGQVFYHLAKRQA